MHEIQGYSKSPLYALASLSAQPLAPPAWSTFSAQANTQNLDADAQLESIIAPTPPAPKPPAKSKTQLAEIESAKCRRLLPLQNKGVATSKGVRKRAVSFESKATASKRRRLIKHRTSAVRARDDMLLHRRFLHAAGDRLQKTSQSEGVEGLTFTNSHDKHECDSCPFAMALKAPFASKKLGRATAPGGRVYTDLKTVKVRSLRGMKYMACLVDDFSRFGRIFFLRSKDEFLEKAMKPYLQFLSRHGITLKELYSDNGGEYTSDELASYLSARKIRQAFSPPHCQSQNGVAEVYWREIMKMTRYALHDQQRPLTWWPAGASMAADIKNSLITKAVADVPPAVAFFDKIIDVSHFRVPLCDAFPYIEKENRDGPGGTDLGERRGKMVLVGFDDDSRCYRLWDPKSKATVSRRYADVLFDERPKAAHGTPTVATATPLEVRIFRDETDDGLSRVDQCVSALNPALEEAEPATIVLQGSGPRRSPRSKNQYQDATKLGRSTTTSPPPSPSEKGGGEVALPNKGLQGQSGSPRTRGTRPPPASGGSSSSATRISPDGYITLSKNLTVRQIADLFDVDADEYLAFLHRTPGGDGTWMAKIKGVSTTIRSGSHVPAPVFDAPPLDDEKQQCRRKERAFALIERRRAIEEQTSAWLEEIAPYLQAAKDSAPAACSLKHKESAYASFAFSTAVPRAKDPAPKGYTASTKGRDAPVWDASRQKEWDGAQARQPPTFEEGHSSAKIRAEGHRLHHLHWVFKTKPDKDKSRIVLNGTQQDPGTYGDVYSPTAHMTTFRLVMAKAAEHKWELFSDDASQAFLNALRPADKPLYCKYPPGIKPSKSAMGGSKSAAGATRPKYRADACLKVNRYIYGLHDSPAAWRTH